jgi:ABC-type transport system substrate-binding protein
MAIDGDVLLDVFHNVNAFQSQGIPVEPYRYTCVPAWCNLIYTDEYWLNPHDSRKFGPNVKYYQHNPEEARKLVTAAGYSSGLDTVANWATGYGGDVYPRYAESAAAFAAEVGINLRANTSPITGDFRAKYADNPGEFDGVTYRLRVSGGIFDPLERAFLEFTPAGGVSYTGFFSEDSSYKKGDPRYTEFLKKARLEFDNERRIALSQEFQRMEAENQYQPSFPGTASILKLVWPVLRNENVFYASSGPYVGQWLDPTKPPVANS